MRLFSRAVLYGLWAGFALLLSEAAEEKVKVVKEALPTGTKILERYASAIGGKEAFKKHKSQQATATIEMPAQKITGKMEIFAARPNKMVMKVTMPGLGETTTGYNGEVGWLNTAITGPMLLEGGMLEETVTQADFDHSLHDPADYKTIEVIGKEDFNGEECYKLRLVHRSDFESTEYFSVKTGLQQGFIATTQTPFGPVAATTIVSDYKKFGDLLMPAKTIQKASGIETVITIEEMQYDKVDPAIFETPKEVKTLLEQKKQEVEEAQLKKKTDNNK